jgi:hypothetical protein
MSASATLRSALAFLAVLLLSASAHAQIFRAYLTSDGNDANPCTLPQPCRLLPAALNAVADGGEIWMLDSANYNTGPVNITKSVTILAVPGVVGSVVAKGGNAIDINTAGVKVALRNLVIAPFPGGGGLHGIVVSNGTALTVENCLIANLPQTGIYVNTAATVRVADTTIRDNGWDGIDLFNGALATIARVTLSGNVSIGIYVSTTAGTTTKAAVSNTVLSGSFYGYVVTSHTTGTAVLTVGNSVSTGNSYGLYQDTTAGSSTLESLGNNLVRQNATPVFGTVTVVSPM